MKKILVLLAMALLFTSCAGERLGGWKHPTVPQYSEQWQKDFSECDMRNQHVMWGSYEYFSRSNATKRCLESRGYRRE